jgi:CubicO group peptidase (beta-lactamase class C family)
MVSPAGPLRSIISLMKAHRFVMALSIAIVSAAAVLPFARQAAAPTMVSAVDAVFAQWTDSTPGCAVGVGVAGTPVLEKAYGMADLEHDVRNTPDTVFEAGSVSKQFTAAAVLLLATDGKLSLDDPVRKHVPELPDYGAPLLIRHMLNHQSGLRDWGSVAGIGGWPRTSRVYTHAHVLDIISRQKALNFTPGAQYSYSNSGYNLAAMIVTRVSGKPFAEFSQERIFRPLGMVRTSWRDDFRRIVKRRAIAYSGRGGAYGQLMPFENVHGNGGLLTTVGDLLRWNENFVTPKVGDAAFVRRQQEPGVFNDGRPGTYALGLVVGRYKGVPEVSHSGSTAGYTAHLLRYPDQHLSVAVLCNASSATATQYAHAVADLYLGDAIKGFVAPPPPARLPAGPAYRPTVADLQSFAGTYTSDEAETTLGVKLEGDDLVLTRRPDTSIRLQPTTSESFSAGPLGTIRFVRTPSGATELSVSEARVFDLRFRKIQ